MEGNSLCFQQLTCGGLPCAGANGVHPPAARGHPLRGGQPHTTNPMAVGKAIEEQLCTLPHQLRVTAHHPEAFLSTSTCRLTRKTPCAAASSRWTAPSSSCVPGTKVTTRRSSSSRSTCASSSRISPCSLWSLEGADEALGDFGRVNRLDSHTHERGHTKHFACLLWVWDVAYILQSVRSGCCGGAPGAPTRGWASRPQPHRPSASRCSPLEPPGPCGPRRGLGTTLAALLPLRQTPAHAAWHVGCRC